MALGRCRTGVVMTFTLLILGNQLESSLHRALGGKEEPHNEQAPPDSPKPGQLARLSPLPVHRIHPQLGQKRHSGSKPICTAKNAA
jgi:hypothetical protein